MAGGRTWDNEETRHLERLVDQRRANKEIAARLGRTVPAIRNRKAILGLPHTIEATCPHCARSFRTPKNAPRSHCTNICRGKHRTAQRLAARPSDHCPCGKPLPDQASFFCSQTCNAHAWYERTVADAAGHALRLETHRDYLNTVRAASDDNIAMAS
ncbi:hypothetical protein [Tessaracoccus sp.]